MFSDFLDYNLYIACILVWILIGVTLFIKGSVVTKNETKTNVSIFVCLLFTSGLDIGLLLFPLTEFSSYKGSKYLGINPVSIELGFWGFSVWGFYFLATCYFLFVEPRINLFEKKYFNVVFMMLIILTCAFSVNLFVDFFLSYQVDIFERPLFTRNEIIVLATIIIALGFFLSKTNSVIKLISTCSVILFILTVIIGGISIIFNGDFIHLLNIMLKGTTGYINNFDEFLTPMNDYHQFYLFWWFSWSIMVGKFTAQYTPKGLTIRNLFVIMILIPTMPLILWFSILFYFSESVNNISDNYLYLMFFVGVLFLINSLSAIFNVIESMAIKLTRNKKFPRYLLFIFMVIAFCLYSFKSGNESLLKIDYTGTVSIFVFYMIVISIIHHKFSIKN